MAELAGLKRKLDTIEDFQSVVRTMKALAAVNIRQYEQAVESLEAYNDAVERGLQAALMGRATGAGSGLGSSVRGPLVAAVFGSDQGMAGQLNEQIADFAENAVKDLEPDPKRRRLLVVGDRARVLLEDRGLPVAEYLTVPTSPAGITPGVQDILMRLEGWSGQLGQSKVYLFFNRHTSGASYKPAQVRLLPLDEEWLARIKARPWPGRSLPLINMDWDALFSGLVRQYLFVSIFRAFAQSLASENASRLAAMQSAERNIEEQRAEVKTSYHQQRQSAITEELLDIVAGFAALTESR